MTMIVWRRRAAPCCAAICWSAAVAAAAAPLTGWGDGKIGRLFVLLVAAAATLSLGAWIDHVAVPLSESYGLGISAGLRAAERTTKPAGKHRGRQDATVTSLPLRR